MATGTLEHQLKRYAAYFRGWCQAFGEHDGISSEEDDIHWLFSGRQVGFILPPPITRRLYREVLLHTEPPPLTFTRKSVGIGSLRFALARDREEQILAAMRQVFTRGEDLHVYLTSHLLYGTGARIITLSTKKPLTIIYKEIGTLRIRLS